MYHSNTEYLKNPKKVILYILYFTNMYHSNTEYLNELKKSNTFGCLVLTEFNFLIGFKILKFPLKNF